MNYYYYWNGRKAVPIMGNTNVNSCLFSKMCDQIENEKFLLDHIHIDYKKSKDFFLVDGEGAKEVGLSEGYYENLRENLEYVQNAWLLPLVKHLQTNISLTIDVANDGNFDDHKIPLIIRTETPKDDDFYQKNLYNIFHKLSEYSSFITSISYCGNGHSLSALRITMEVDGRTLSKYIPKKEVDRQFVQQLIFYQDISQREAREVHTYEVNVPVINRKMWWDIKKDHLTRRFDMIKGK
jgi:hypothetical protein